MTVPEYSQAKPVSVKALPLIFSSSLSVVPVVTPSEVFHALGVSSSWRRTGLAFFFESFQTILTRFFGSLLQRIVPF